MQADHEIADGEGGGAQSKKEYSDNRDRLRVEQVCVAAQPEVNYNSDAGEQRRRNVAAADLHYQARRQDVPESARIDGANAAKCCGQEAEAMEVNLQLADVLQFVLKSPLQKEQCPQDDAADCQDRLLDDI